MRILPLKLGHRVKYIIVHVINLTKPFCPLIGTIVASISIVTSDGSPLCTLTQVEIERHDSSPQVPVSMRFDTAFPPWEIPSAIVEDRDILIAESDDMRQFYSYLDYQASNVLSQTILNKLLPGKEVILPLSIRYYVLIRPVARSQAVLGFRAHNRLIPDITASSGRKRNPRIQSEMA